MKTKRSSLQKIKHPSILFAAMLIAQISLAQSSNLQTNYAIEPTKREYFTATTKFTVIITRDFDDQKFKLLVNNPTQQKLQVTVKSRLMELYYDKTTDLTYSKLFNLSNVEDGEYTISVTNGKQEFTKSITLNTITEVNRKIDIY